MKKPLLVLSSALIASSIFASSSVFASETTKVEPYNYSEVKEKYFSDIPQEVKDLNSVKYIGNEDNKPELLTEKEINLVNPFILNEIYKELEDDINSGKYTEKQLDKMAAKKIKEKGSEFPSSTNRALMAASADYEVDVPGFGTLTEAELKLAALNPIEFTKYGATALTAYNETVKYYATQAVLYQGNGDAFRHSFWNAIMVVNYGGSSPLKGMATAEKWATAHESTSSGNDKEMDLMNNEIGRYHAYMNYYNTNSQFSYQLRKMVAQGTMARIVNGNLTATSSYTGK